MPELVRSIAARLREFVGNRRREPRYQTRLPFSVSLVDSKIGGGVEGQPTSLKGHTRDISLTGLGLIVPAIRIGGRYLTGEHRKLRITLELSGRPLQIQATSVRYEQLDSNSDETGYLIGVRIIEMSDGDRARFAEYIGTLS